MIISARPERGRGAQALDPEKRPSTSLGTSGVCLALSDAVALLTDASDTPRLDAELLLAHALGISREALLLGRDRAVPRAYNALLQRRLAHEPVAYITGTKSFWSLDLNVTPAVLIPRPDSETLIDAAIEYFRDRSPKTILDLGVGSGALLLASLDQWPTGWGVGVDRSAPALAVARGNAQRLGLGARACFVQGSWADAVDSRFDLILCNPPYVEDSAKLAPDVAEYEPRLALFAGAEGLDDYRRLAPQLGRLLAPGGVAVVEIGANQRESVTALIQVGDLHVTCRQDLAQRDRCLVVTQG